MKDPHRDPRPVHEDKIQKAIIEMMSLKCLRGVLYYHIPNQAKRSEATTAWLKNMGMLVGAPDIGMVLPGGRAAFLEVKVPQGRVSREQWAFGDAAAALGGLWAIVHSVSEAERVLSEWGALRGFSAIPVTAPGRPIGPQRADGTYEAEVAA